MAGFFAAVLLTSVCIGITKQTATVKDGIPLDMAPDSVDDMYSGCMPAMEKEAEKYLKNEKNGNIKFKQAWEEAETHWGGKKKRKTPQFRLALYVYTLNNPNVYLDFNNAVRTQKSVYSTTFRYHSLHFYLTKGIQHLNSKKCFTAYRRSKSSFSPDVLNTEIRFGSFTSSSQGAYPDPVKFGDKSCFKIQTCFGADISEYSAVKSENEVLIPPYEVFKVTKVEKRADKKPCEVVYEVTSTQRTLSNLNCALV